MLRPSSPKSEWTWTVSPALITGLPGQGWHSAITRAPANARAARDAKGVPGYESSWSRPPRRQGGRKPLTTAPSASMIIANDSHYAARRFRRAASTRPQTHPATSFGHRDTRRSVTCDDGQRFASGVGRARGKPGKYLSNLRVDV